MLPLVMRLLGDSWLELCGIRAVVDSYTKVASSSWKSVLLRQIGLAACGWILCMFVSRSEYLTNTGAASELLLSLLCLVCLCLAGFSTHHVGGMWYQNWRFYQPLAGGPLFVMLQGVSWTLFGISLFMVGLNLLCALVQIFNLACLSCIPARVGDIASLPSATGLGLIAE